MQPVPPENKLDKSVASGERWEETLVHLTAGEIRGWQRWWLHWRIRRDPYLRAEYQELQMLWSDLRTMQRTAPVRTPIFNANRTSSTEPMLTIGGFTMKRRLFLTAYVIFLLAVTGAIATRQLLVKNPLEATGIVDWVEGPVVSGDVRPGEYGATFGSQPDWELRGTFRGKVKLMSADGRTQYTDPFPGIARDGELFVYCRLKPVPNWPADRAWNDMPYDFRVTLRGNGKYPIKDKKGNLLAWVTLKPWSTEEEDQIEREARGRREAYLDFLRSPERLAPSWERGAAEPVVEEEGVAAGRLPEAGVSWKLYGYARITARYPDYPKQVQKARTRRPRQQLLSPEQEKKIKQQLETASPAVREGYLQQRQTAEQEYRERLKLMPKPDQEPVIYWAVAGGEKSPATGQVSYDAFYPDAAIAQLVPAEGGYLVNKQGRWMQVKESGTVKGYGHHEIKDASGKVILTLDITPL